MTHRSHPKTVTFTQTDDFTIDVETMTGVHLATLRAHSEQSMIELIGRFVWWSLESVDDPPDVGDQS